LVCGPQTSIQKIYLLKLKRVNPFLEKLRTKVVWWNDFWVSNRESKADWLIRPEPKGIDNFCQAVSLIKAFANDKH
jgi:hypothetical protein